MARCAPLCGASKAYGRFDKPWKHEPECPVRQEWEASRYVTSVPDTSRSRADTDSTTAEPRFRLFRLCPCETCEGTGKVNYEQTLGGYTNVQRCPECRGEGRVRQEVATAATPADVGVALVTLGREGEWEGCAFGLLDTQGEVGEKWVLRPWLPSARNISEAARVLAKSKGEKKP